MPGAIVTSAAVVLEVVILYMGTINKGSFVIVIATHLIVAVVLAERIHLTKKVFHNRRCHGHLPVAVVAVVVVVVVVVCTGNLRRRRRRRRRKEEGTHQQHWNGRSSR